MKGNGPHHGFIFYKAADGTLLNEFNGYGRVIVVDGKPQSLGVGWWHTVVGTGRYANGTGSGTYTSRLALPDFEGATEWDGTFVEVRQVAASRHGLGCLSDNRRPTRSRGP